MITLDIPIIWLLTSVCPAFMLGAFVGAVFYAIGVNSILKKLGYVFGKNKYTGEVCLNKRVTIE
jgi:hypothetical protein